MALYVILHSWDFEKTRKKPTTVLPPAAAPPHCIPGAAAFKKPKQPKV
jgi:hypothetical protein